MAMLSGIQGAGAVKERTGGGNSFAPLPAGGYVCKILNVKVEETKNGAQYIKLRIDVAEGEYAGFFQRRWNADAQSEYGQKWKGVFKIFLPRMTNDAKKYEDDIALYKGKLNTIARSNNLPEPDVERGFDPDIFKNCLVGVLFRDAEYNGNAFTEAAFLANVADIRSGNFQVPSPREEKKQTGSGFYQPQNTPQSGFTMQGGVFAAAQQAMAQNGFQQPQSTFTQPQPQNSFAQPAPAPSPAQIIGDLSDFEEVQTSGDIPF